MTHYLRCENNETLVDCDAGKDDLHCSVIIGVYSHFLLDHLDKKDEVIYDFSLIQELRGIWFEHYNMRKQYDFNIDKFIAAEFKLIAKKYDLYYVTD